MPTLSMENSQEISVAMDNRLDKIEEKIDRLTDAMVSIARAEEKLINIEEKYQNQFDRLNRFSEKLDRIEAQVGENAGTVKLINKLFWVAVAAVIGGFAANILM